MRNYKKIGNMNDDDQRGAALVLSILAMLLITVLAVVLISTGMVSGNVSTNSRQQTEAYYISESGLNHAIRLISEMTPTPAVYTSILRAGDVLAGTGDELSTAPIPTALTIIPAATAGGMAFGNGSYRVFVRNDPADPGNAITDTNRRLLITSIGIGRDGSTATTEAIIFSSTFPAILVNGNLQISGNPTVFGAGGAVHANGNVTVNGNPCVSEYVNSTSTVSVGGSLSGAGCSGSGTSNNNQPPITLPSYNLQADFKSRADYVLGSDGKVRNQAGTLQTMSGNDWYPSGGGKWTWESGNQNWKHTDSAMLSNKTFYVVGNMELASDFGSTASPVPATFIAEGSITVSANPIVTKYLDNKFAFLAGKDLTLNGNPASGHSSAGIHYARDQIKLNGNPRILGVILAANVTDTNSPGGIGNPVPLSSGRMEISGNAQVTYDGGLMDEKPTLLSWREVRY